MSVYLDLVSCIVNPVDDVQRNQQRPDNAEINLTPQLVRIPLLDDTEVRYEDADNPDDCGDDCI